MYYYGGVLMRMFMADGGKDVQGVENRPYLAATLIVATAGTIFLGIFPSWAFELARGAFLSLGLRSRPGLGFAASGSAGKHHPSDLVDQPDTSSCLDRRSP